MANRNRKKKRPFLTFLLILLILFLIAGAGVFLYFKTSFFGMFAPDKQEWELSRARVGDIVEYGYYNGLKNWRVLEKDDYSLLLISEEIVEKKAYNDENVDCSWSDSTLREWLNTDFYIEAFSQNERSKIISKFVDGEYDNVYILSSEEINEYFDDSKDMEAVYDGRVWSWWERSAVWGRTGAYNAYFVYHKEGESVSVDNPVTGVRPVICVSISDEEEQQHDRRDDYAELAFAEVGDVVEFGSYNNVTKWKVMTRDEEALVLFCEEIVDKKAYNGKNSSKCEWENSGIREWLNTEYFDTAFNEMEQALIKDSEIDGCTDKVYLFSQGEVKSFYKVNADKICSFDGKPSWWWYRAPVKTVYGDRYATAIYEDGRDYSVSIADKSVGVRPAISIDLKRFKYVK